jgi:hypothetical protein
MTEHEELQQPQNVSNPVTDYLDMTIPPPRAPKKRPPRREDPPRSRPRPIDNSGLSLEEGNDYA